jgi:large subunit ribosomal protein L28
MARFPSLTASGFHLARRQFNPKTPPAVGLGCTIPATRYTGRLSFCETKRPAMAKACDCCGKSPQVGNSVTLRGKAKYLGGVGTKITGITRRQFKPNLQRVRVTVNGSNMRVRVCTQCIRSGSVTKLVRAAPFKLPTSEATAKAKAAKSQPKAGQRGTAKTAAGKTSAAKGAAAKGAATKGTATKGTAAKGDAGKAK